MAYCQSVEHNPNYYQNSSSRAHHPSLYFYLVRLDPGLDTSQSFKLFQNKNVKKRLKRKKCEKCEGQKSFHDPYKKLQMKIEQKTKRTKRAPKMIYIFII